VISRSGEVLGGLFFGHAETGKFQMEHETALLGIAGHAATAIDNARLFQAAERELSQRRKAETDLQTLNATLEQRVTEEIADRLKAEEQLRQAQKMEAVGQLRAASRTTSTTCWPSSSGDSIWRSASWPRATRTSADSSRAPWTARGVPPT
jgi:Tfp pilus assembly protein PilX